MTVAILQENAQIPDYGSKRDQNESLTRNRLTPRSQFALYLCCHHDIMKLMSQPSPKRMAKHFVAFLFMISGILILLVFLPQYMGHRPEQPLKIGTNIWPGYAPLHLAQSSGFYPQPIQLKTFRSTSQVERALRNEIIDAAAVTLDEFLTLRQYIPDLQIVLVLDVSHGGDGIVANHPITSVSDLAGKSVAVNATTLGNYVLKRALSIENIPLESIKPVTFPANFHPKMLRDGKVDAAVSYNPYLSVMMAEGAHLIFDSSRIPGEIFGVLVAPSATIRNRRRDIESSIVGWFAALQKISEQPAQTHAQIAAYLGIDQTQVVTQLSGLLFPGPQQALNMIEINRKGSVNGSIAKLAEIVKLKRTLMGIPLFAPEPLQFLVPSLNRDLKL